MKKRKLNILIIGAFCSFVGVSAIALNYGEARYKLHDSEIIVVDQDKVQSIKELSMLAAEGVPEAMGRLAQEYYDGVLINQNDNKALYWTKKGADAKDARALILLAKFYYEGGLLAQDKEKAIGLMEQITENRMDAKYILGRMYIGNMVGKDENLEKGLDLIQLAADSGMPLAQYDYARSLLANVMLLKRGNDINQDQFKSLIEKKSAEYMAMAVAQDFVPAMTYLGLYFYNGTGVAKDENRGLRLLETAAKKGNDEAVDRLLSQNFVLGFDNEDSI